MASGVLLTIAGHDPSGGAGLTTDLATWAAMGWRGASACTALTVQDGAGVRAVLPTPVDLLRGAMDAGGIGAAGVKIGMLGSAEVGLAVADWCAGRDVPVVWDPVLAAAAGGSLLRGDAGAALDAMARVATAITPNRDEAAALLGVPPWAGDGAPPPEWIAAARRRWLDGGRCRMVLIKGGHAEGGRAVDWLITGDAAHGLAVDRVADRGGRPHGTGCLYASALAAMLAEGWTALDAAAEAQCRTRAAIAGAWAAPSGRVMAEPRARPCSDDLPELAMMADPRGAPGAQRGASPAPHTQRDAFPALPRPPGLYPIVPDADWVLRLLEWGVDTVQLRIKDRTGPDLAREIARAARAADQAGAQLFINDHWREAVDAGAWGVHLGQDDLDPAALAALRAAGLRLGVSTHSPAELARAHALGPSYIAFGPLWPTASKTVEHRPLGLARLRDWTARCKPRYPVVAIGGIDLERAREAFACGVDGVAVIGAVVGAADPHAAVRRGLDLARHALG